MSEISERINRIRANIGRVIVGREEAVDLLLATLAAGGHALLEDVPGMGKTLLAKALARSLGCDFKRVQFTPDLLPSDLSGIYFFNQQTGAFEFRPGPLFTHILLADEINRATPRTQASLLESMEERQITIEGKTHVLRQPFMVIATQNPVEHRGTFPLPEAQLDRFLMRISFGYPSFEDEVAILERFRERNPLDDLAPVLSAEEAVNLQRLSASVRVHPDLVRYIVRIAEASRRHPDVALGISPRGSQALLRAAQAYALVQGRDHVVPDDVKRLAVPVLAHRLLLHYAAPGRASRPEEVVRGLLAEIEVPAESLSP
ncbi:MAG: magnesium chelatase [Paenibacillaceae bacterium ZCTH02-B3]|nr:MAG: magnesium chelatase [Paenibacillaceae bacterium ZCTH02-B3]